MKNTISKGSVNQERIMKMKSIVRESAIDKREKRRIVECELALEKTTRTRIIEGDFFAENK